MNLLHVEITHLLRVHATCYNFRFQQGNTPLHLAALGNQSEVTKILIKKKCQVDIQNYVSVLSLQKMSTKTSIKLKHFHIKNA